MASAGPCGDPRWEHPRLKTASATWESTGLPELGLAITTKLELLPQVASQLEDLLALHRLLAAVDSFLYEFRSAYEISGKLLKALYLHVLGKGITEKELRDLLREAGLQDGWIEDLADQRKLFFHQTAPWLSLRVDSRAPWRAELLILRRNVQRFAESNEVVPLSRLVAIYRGFGGALGVIRDRLVADIRALDDNQKQGRPA